VIQYLLKEKQSQANQNAQLWRLVDKQRAMILGLNKDLERALKDKERYRKKLKESLAQLSNPSPVESNQGLASEAGSASSDHGNVQAMKPSSPGGPSPVEARDQEQREEELPSPIDVALAPYPITPTTDKALTRSLSNLVEPTHKMPSPTKHAFQNYNPDGPVAGFEAGQQQRKANEVAREAPYNVSLPPSRSLPSDPPRGPPPKVPPPKAPMSPPPSVSVIESSPNTSSNTDGAFQRYPNPPPRKPPPAPLDLGQNNVPSSHLRQASEGVDDSSSDYDDILEVDEIPAFPERGRRKTREEDDRERELAAMREAELRSLSKKSKKSKSRTPKTPKDSTFEAAKESIPLSPRQTIPIPPPADLRPPIDSNAGSLVGMLASAKASDTKTSFISPPLMSPGLPKSPRPVDRGASPPSRQPGSSNHSSSMSPPMSPRMGAFSGAVPLSPRAPRQPIPLPPNTPLSIVSPGLAKGEHPVIKRPTEPRNNSPTDDVVSRHSPSDSSGIYRGFVTEEYPDLLLAPNALPSIDVKVASSRLRPSRASQLFPKDFEEDPVFTLAVFSRANGRELWRVEKDSTSLTNLDQALKQSSLVTAKVPEKSLFSGHAPAKVDARRVALDTYLDEILNTQMDTASALEICRYLSTNTLEPDGEDLARGDSNSGSPVKTGPGGRPFKNGYLTKRGKNFGGWKARFFVLDGPVLKYYESPGGAHLGAIKLQNAQIGKQHDSQSPPPANLDDVENQYRHAFLILEPKRKDSSSLVRHVLCAESDKERDQWVEALLQYVDYKDEDGDHVQRSHKEHDRNNSGGSSHTTGLNAKKKMYGKNQNQSQNQSQSQNQNQNQNPTVPENDDFRGISYDTTKQGAIPVGARSKNDTPSPPLLNGHERDSLTQSPQSQTTKSISAPKNAQVIQDVGAWGNKQTMLAPQPHEEKKQKKRSFFGFGSKSRPSVDLQDSGANDANSNLSQMAYEQHGPIRPVFGAPLGEAVKYNHPADVPNIELPAVVYRCIEYLDFKNAAAEEGIFRLSGSNVVIKQLRERFNTEGDVNLVTDEQYYDIHAVASLLKLYLRELPTTILTRELHLEFLAVTELHDLDEKISALNRLVHRLPSANNSLLRYLSSFLINIINHSDQNKMTVRNVGIVFSPTLNIPAPVFALFLQQYDGIFAQEPDDHDQHTVEVTVTAPPLTPEDIRSPRQQIFQNLPTPSYDQQSFPQAQHYQPQQRAVHDTGFTPLQPAYEAQYPSFTMAGPEYGNRGPTVAGPAYDQLNGDVHRYLAADSSSGSKNKRRESNMFALGMGQKKASSNNNKSRDERESTFT
jgi:RalA-binding protein 1